MKLIWEVSVKRGRKRQRMLCDSFKEGWEDFKTHDWRTLKLIYPKLVKKTYWENLADFGGW